MDSANNDAQGASDQAVSEQQAAPAAAYAIIRSGGKQYRVTAGSVVTVERLAGAVGDEVSFKEVLIMNSGGGAAARIGTPVIEGAEVRGRIVAQGQDRKVIIFKKKLKKGYTKKQGHRQQKTSVRIEALS